MRTSPGWLKVLVVLGSAVGHAACFAAASWLANARMRPLPSEEERTNEEHFEALTRRFRVQRDASIVGFQLATILMLALSVRFWSSDLEQWLIAVYLVFANGAFIRVVAFDGTIRWLRLQFEDTGDVPRTVSQESLFLSAFIPGLYTAMVLGVACLVWLLVQWLIRR